jgi:Flp pilus assembly protein CpaB
VELTQQLLSTRRGTIFVGAAAAALAFVLLIVYLNRYRQSLGAESVPTPVLVAKALIEKGTPGDVVASAQQFELTSLPASNLKAGALEDPATLAGRVAVKDIYPGQQLTTADFAASASNALVGKLTGSERAIAVPVDDTHGLVGDVQAGDRVDVFVGFNNTSGGVTQPVVKLLMENALVLRPPAKEGDQKKLVLRASGAQAGQLAFAADNGQIWVVLRPAAGAKRLAPELVTVDRLLAAKPIAAGR